MCFNPKSWWQQVVINFTVHNYYLPFLCLQYILRKKRLTFWEISKGLNFTCLTRNDEKSDFWPWKWGVDLYTSKYGIKSKESEISFVIPSFFVWINNIFNLKWSWSDFSRLSLQNTPLSWNFFAIDSQWLKLNERVLRSQALIVERSLEVSLIMAQIYIRFRWLGMSRSSIKDAWKTRNRWNTSCRTGAW